MDWGARELGKEEEGTLIRHKPTGLGDERWLRISVNDGNSDNWGGRQAGLLYSRTNLGGRI